MPDYKLTRIAPCPNTRNPRTRRRPGGVDPHLSRRCNSDLLAESPADRLNRRHRRVSLAALKAGQGLHTDPRLGGHFGLLETRFQAVPTETLTDRPAGELEGIHVGTFGIVHELHVVGLLDEAERLASYLHLLDFRFIHRIRPYVLLSRRRSGSGLPPRGTGFGNPPSGSGNNRR